MRKILISTLGVAVLFFAGCKSGSGSPATPTTQMSDAMGATTMPELMYTCTMHPNVESTVPGKCPICGMELVPKK